MTAGGAEQFDGYFQSIACRRWGFDSPYRPYMRISDISKAYCKANGLTLYTGRLGDDDPLPILAFIIMDCAYQEFKKEIKPLSFRHGNKRWVSEWMNTYHHFNSRLFSTLDADRRDFAIDLMDAYADALSYDVMLMRVAVMDLVSGCEFADQKVISSLMLCDIFAKVAQISWGLVYKTERNTEERCPELDKMWRISHTLANSVALLPENVKTNESPKLGGAIKAYMDKTSKWLKSYGND